MSGFPTPPPPPYGRPLWGTLGQCQRHWSRHFAWVCPQSPVARKKPWFEYGGWILGQDIKGVPIGGHLSPQLMCLWALVQEIQFIESPQDVFKQVVQSWPSAYPPITLTPSPTLMFPHFASVPKNTNYFNESGMAGWFDQDYKLLGTLQLLTVR